MACGGCAKARAARLAAAQEAGTNRSAPVRQTAASASTTQANQLRQPAGRTQTFSLVLPTGKSIPFGSKLEAEAENVRRGYVGQVRKI